MVTTALLLVIRQAIALKPHYNLIRGSGADGLQALTWRRRLSSGLALVRPSRDHEAETAQFCQDMQLTVWEDSTNQDLKYAVTVSVRSYCLICKPT